MPRTTSPTRPPFAHEPDQHFQWLADYLRHLVDAHGITETPELWRSGRTDFDVMHAKEHGVETLP